MKSSLATLPKTIFTGRAVETLESAEISFIGRIGSVFSCDKLLIAGDFRSSETDPNVHQITMKHTIIRSRLYK